MGALALFDPFKELSRFQRSWPNALGNWEGNELVKSFSPSVEIHEDNEAYYINAELPGLTKEDIKLGVEESVLSLSGEKKSKKEVKKEGYYYSERSEGKFSRRFELPENVQAEKINAKMEHGILEVMIPKEPKEEPKSIEVKVS